MNQVAFYSGSLGLQQTNVQQICLKQLPRKRTALFIGLIPHLIFFSSGPLALLTIMWSVMYISAFGRFLEFVSFQNPLTSTSLSLSWSLILWTFNYHFIFWVTPSLFYLWPMRGCLLKGQQMCVWFTSGTWVSRYWVRKISTKCPKPSSYQEGELQQQAELWTAGIPAAIGFIYVWKGVERRGSWLSSAHARWGSGQL